jgi:hypothetical protein
MKANPWLLPGAAVLITGGWIAFSKHSAATLAREITVLSERIRQVGGAGRDDPEAGAENSRSWRKEKIDWKGFAGKINQSGDDDGGDVRAMMRIRWRLLDMSAEDLFAQLDEIVALDIDLPARQPLQMLVLDTLIDKDPKRVIDRFSSEIGDEDSWIRQPLLTALRNWAETEPAAAIAWLDRQIAAGKFESRSLSRENRTLLDCQGRLVGALLRIDPGAAFARVASLPEEQGEVFFREGFCREVEEGNDAAFAKLVRDHVPPDKVGGFLASKAMVLASQGGYEQVDGLIASAEATDAEKKNIVERVMTHQLEMINGPDIADALDMARAWGATHSPGSVDAVTGQALANWQNRDPDFRLISKLVLQYNERSSGDAVLAEFLKTSQAFWADLSMPLIDQIKDPTLREEIRALPQYRSLPPDP